MRNQLFLVALFTLFREAVDFVLIELVVAFEERHVIVVFDSVFVVGGKINAQTVIRLLFDRPAFDSGVVLVIGDDFLDVHLIDFRRLVGFLAEIILGLRGIVSFGLFRQFVVLIVAGRTRPGAAGTSVNLTQSTVTTSSGSNSVAHLGQWAGLRVRS